MRQMKIVDRGANATPYDQLGEGPVWDEEAQVLWWVDIVGCRVQRFDPSDGHVRNWRVDDHVSAAIPCVSGGLILAMAGGLARLDAGSGMRNIFARPDSDPGNRSNECRTDPRGAALAWDHVKQLGAGRVAPRPLRGSTGGLFRVEADGRSTQILSGVGISNTLAWSPDGDRLYFADSLKGVIWSFRFDLDDGTVTERRVFAAPDIAPGAPDGSAVDEEGCLWNARWGAGVVVRFAPDGRVDRTLKVPALQPTCVAFGGADRTTLYVTSARHGLKGLGPGQPRTAACSHWPQASPACPSRRFAGVSAGVQPARALAAAHSQHRPAMHLVGGEGRLVEVTAKAEAAHTPASHHVRMTDGPTPPTASTVASIGKMARRAETWP